MKFKVAIIVLMELFLPVYGQEKALLPKSGQTSTEQKQRDSNPVSLTVTYGDSKPQGNQTASKSDGASKQPEGYFSTLASPNNLPNDGLFLIGLAGVCVAVWTLRTIKRQVDTFVSKERARLTVDVDSFEPAEAGVPWFAKMTITNHGSTNAFIGPAICLPCINAANWDTKDAHVRHTINLPSVIKPNEGIEFSPPVQLRNDLKWEFDEETIASVGNGFAGIFLVGLIEYRDVFGGRWSLKFWRKWNGTHSHGKWLFTDWKEYDPLGANGEYGIRKPTIPLRFWRHLRRRDPNAVVARKAN